ncbi:MAG: hypothetical protein L6R48_08710, partial [Planctomycetes bacterium]|nr:hypothetical protein [Planctomycetota bacterium]
ALPAAPAPAALDADLDLLRRASPAIRRQLVEAAARTVAADGLVTAGEAELVRAVADSLGCPLPPFADAAGRYRAAPRPQSNATAPTGAGAPP